MFNRRKSVGWMVSFLTKKKVYELVLYYILFEIFLACVFWVFYPEGALVEADCSIVSGVDVLAQIYYCISTQMTVGFGDIHPVGMGRGVFIAHIVLANVLNTLFLGVVVAKMVWPSDTLVVSKYVVFDVATSRFKVRYYNALNVRLVCVATLMYFTVIKDKRSTSTYKIKMQKDVHPWLSYHNSINSYTKKISIDSVQDDISHRAAGLLLHPLHFNEHTKLKIVISGNYEMLGGLSYFQTKEISSRNVLCGSFRDVGEIGDWKKYGTVEVVSSEVCDKCFVRDNCMLRLNNEGYSEKVK